MTNKTSKDKVSETTEELIECNNEGDDWGEVGINRILTTLINDTLEAEAVKLEKKRVEETIEGRTGRGAKSITAVIANRAFQHSADLIRSSKIDV